jgi:hypothetical protein
MTADFSLSWLDRTLIWAGCIYLVVALPMAALLWLANRGDRGSFAWFVRILGVRWLVLEAFAILPLALGGSLPPPLAFSAGTGILAIAYISWLGLGGARGRLISEPGCSILLLLLPGAALPFVVYLVALVFGFSTDWLLDLAGLLLSLFWLLGPIVYHLNIVEQCYFQVRCAAELRRDLGFQSDTNTLEGTWPVGQKYLYFTNVEPGGLMERAGFQTGDIVVEPRTFTEFWYRLEKGRGGDPVPIVVVSPSGAEPVSRRPRRRLSVRVPPAPTC